MDNPNIQEFPTNEMRLKGRTMQQRWRVVDVSTGADEKVWRDVPTVDKDAPDDDRAPVEPEADADPANPPADA